MLVTATLACSNRFFNSLAPRAFSLGRRFRHILLVGGAAGGLFTRRGNLIAPYAAHLALNLVEFLFVLGMH